MRIQFYLIRFIGNPWVHYQLCKEPKFSNRNDRQTNHGGYHLQHPFQCIPMAFAKRDAQVESDFTSKQPGFIKRQSGVDEEGTYVVVVFWKV